MMHPFGGLFGIVLLLADVWAIVNVVGSVSSTMAKVVWILLVLLLPVVGVLVWLFAGPRTSRA